MPANTALRVIKRTFDNDDDVIAKNRYDAFAGGVSEEEAVLGAYQILADEMGATLDVTLDGQIVLYTGYFKPSLQKVIDLYEPKSIELEEVVAHRERNVAICAAAGRYIEAREPTPEDLTREEYEELKNKESK
jgi:hypothetical protein